MNKHNLVRRKRNKCGFQTPEVVSLLLLHNEDTKIKHNMIVGLLSCSKQRVPSCGHTCALSCHITHHQQAAVS